MTDEYAVACLGTDRYKNCIELCDELLQNEYLPVNEVGRVWYNRNEAVKKLDEQ